MTPRTSKRHTDILNTYQAKEGRFFGWAQESLGGLAITDWEYGKVSMTWDISDKFIMPDGFMFGGFVACVADHLVGLVSMSVLENELDRFRTSRLETNYFRPVLKPAARIEARTTNVSKTLIHAEADIFTPEDKLAVRIYAVQVLAKRDTKGPLESSSN